MGKKKRYIHRVKKFGTKMFNFLDKIDGTDDDKISSSKVSLEIESLDVTDRGNQTVKFTAKVLGPVTSGAEGHNIKYKVAEVGKTGAASLSNDICSVSDKASATATLTFSNSPSAGKTVIVNDGTTSKTYEAAAIAAGTISGDSPPKFSRGGYGHNVASALKLAIEHADGHNGSVIVHMSKGPTKADGILGLDDATLVLELKPDLVTAGNSLVVTGTANADQNQPVVATTAAKTLKGVGRDRFTASSRAGIDMPCVDDSGSAVVLTDETKEYELEAQLYTHAGSAVGNPVKERFTVRATDPVAVTGLSGAITVDAGNGQFDIDLDQINSTSKRTGEESVFDPNQARKGSFIMTAAKADGTNLPLKAMDTGAGAGAAAEGVNRRGSANAAADILSSALTSGTYKVTFTFTPRTAADVAIPDSTVSVEKDIVVP